MKFEDAMQENKNDLQSLGISLRSVLHGGSEQAVLVNKLLSEYLTALDKCLDNVLPSPLCLDLEETGWSVHTLVNTWYRQQLNELRKEKKKTVVAERKLSDRSLKFAKSSYHYYKRRLLWLIRNYDFTGRCMVAQKLQAIGCIEEVVEVVPIEDQESHEVQEWAWRVCFASLVRLGDLSRWIEERRSRGVHKWTFASQYYELASFIEPESSTPYHKLAVLNVAAEGKASDSLVFFLRAIALEKVDPAVADNLARFLKKTCRSSRYQELLPATSHEEFEDRLAIFYSHTFAEPDQPLQIGNMSELQQLFDPLLSDPHQAEKTFANMVIMREAMTSFTAQDSQAKLRCSGLSCVNIILLNTAMVTVMINLILPEIPTVLSAGSRSLNMMEQRVNVLLPSLRLYSAWILLYHRYLNCKVLASWAKLPYESKATIDSFWNAYALLLTLLRYHLGGMVQPDLDYLLVEDIVSSHWSPFRNNSKINKRYQTSTGIRKSRPDDIHAHNQGKQNEAVLRFFDIAREGVQVILSELSPLTVASGSKEIQYVG